MNEFINVSIREPVADVLVSGFIDENDTLVYHPMYNRIYFTFDNNIFELYIDDNGYINARNIEKIETWFNVDEDDKFSLMSIYSQAFKTEQEVVISKIIYERIAFSTMSIVYNEGDIERVLVLDPNNFFGFTFL
ncbi:TPA: hypothetical protein SMQ30_001726 [Proteus mirabilis]|uniref:hypothetical protein n=1 Tax=Proteus mirabilis TaxID=584 RepID=UPI0023F74271|nr:hypothetical protein [Proteus mirabilis]MDF7328036.1 hypothetical protein [Proteus mirabilis]HEK1038771.1 hypothetical protein [Proteus mirabilis]